MECHGPGWCHGPHLRQDDLWQRKSQKREVTCGSAHVALASAVPITPSSTPALERGICAFLFRDRVWVGYWVKLALCAASYLLTLWSNPLVKPISSKA